MAKTSRTSKRPRAGGKAAPEKAAAQPHRVVREGGPIVIWTIGYERRDGSGLMAALREAGVEHLADIREKPLSRKADFRAAALRERCEEAGIEYGAWPDLGTPVAQRNRLKATGDLKAFHRTFRAYAMKTMDEPLDRLAGIARKKVVALLCYERAHEECHRSVISELLADRLDAGIIANP